jgi:site-specific DNA-methyltransferase (adenine-specific)
MVDIIPMLVQEALPAFEDCTFDACFCDPPYGLGFMGKEWDHGVPGVGVWREVWRVLKPGAFLMAFGGTRTWHRLAVAIEDAGFELRDTMMWLYGTGFPKSLDVSKAIDKAVRGFPQGGPDPTSSGHGKYKGGCSEENPSGRGFGAGPGQFMREQTENVRRDLVPEAQAWFGHGTAFKPAWEPILVAMKPCEGTFAENALKWGAAGLAIDAGRIVPTGESLQGGGSTCGKKAENHHEGWQRPWMRDSAAREAMRQRSAEAQEKSEVLGRWPANLLLDEEAAAMLDAQTDRVIHSAGSKRSGGRSVQDSDGGLFGVGQHDGNGMRFGDSGGASRFFYCAKASRKERGEGNDHPTVKPLDLCRYLASLLLPPPRPSSPRRILVPFSGSGSEAIGCQLAGWEEVTAIESNPDYTRIHEARCAAVLAGAEAKE